MKSNGKKLDFHYVRLYVIYVLSLVWKSYLTQAIGDTWHNDSLKFTTNEVYVSNWFFIELNENS